MDGNSPQWMLILALGMTVFGVAGCAGPGASSGVWPFDRKVSAALPDIPSPAQRIASLRQLARDASGASEAERQQLVLQLSESIRTEEDPLIRLEMIRTFGAYGGPTADSLLQAALSDPDKEIRIAACQIWGERGDPGAVRLLAGVLNSDLDTDVRLAAIRALGQTKDPTAVAALGNALQDKDPAIQYRTVQSLERVTGEDLGNDVGQWRQYVAGETPQQAKVPSLAARVRDWVTF